MDEQDVGKSSLMGSCSGTSISLKYYIIYSITLSEHLLFKPIYDRELFTNVSVVLTTESCMSTYIHIYIYNIIQTSRTFSLFQWHCVQMMPLGCSMMEFATSKVKLMSWQIKLSSDYDVSSHEFVQTWYKNVDQTTTSCTLQRAGRGHDSLNTATKLRSSHSINTEPGCSIAAPQRQPSFSLLLFSGNSHRHRQPCASTNPK